MGAGQLAFHEAFTALAPAQSCSPARPAGRGHQAPFAWAGCAAETGAALPEPDSWPTLLIPVFHLAAAAVATLLLAKSEAALWAVAARLRPFRARSGASVLLTALGVCAALLLGTTPAQAHDALSSTTPGNGETIATNPGKVTLTLSNKPLQTETLKTSVIKVTAPDGATRSAAVR